VHDCSLAIDVGPDYYSFFVLENPVFVVADAADDLLIRLN